MANVRNDFQVSLLEHNYMSLSDLDSAAKCAESISVADATRPIRFEQWQHQAPYRRALTSLAAQTSISCKVGPLPPPPRMPIRKVQTPDSSNMSVSSALNSV